MTPPGTVPTGAQPHLALEAAHRVRIANAQLKRRLAAQPTVYDGRVAAAEVLEQLPDETARLRLVPFLKAIPWYGADKIRKALLTARVTDPAIRLGELDDRQRQLLASVLRAQGRRR